jgi:hypothetical protein
VVERRELGRAQALNDRKHGGVDEADAQVGVGRKDLPNAPIIARGEILDLVRAPVYFIEHRCDGIAAQLTRGQEVELNQDWRGHYPRSPRSAQQSRTSGVLLIFRVDRGEQRACVDD